MISINKFFLRFSMISVLLILIGANFNVYAKEPAFLEVRMNAPDKISGGEIIKVKIYTDRTRENSAEELVFRLETDNPQIVILPFSEVKILSNKAEVEFEVQTKASPIKTNISIRAFLRPDEQIQVQQSVEIVPARLKSVSFSQPSMIGTHGSKVECAVYLQAPAPAGGIELYLSPFYVAAVSGAEDIYVQFTNLRVPAGSNKFSFQIEYDEIRTNDSQQVSRIDTKTNFNRLKRIVEFIVALDPQQSSGSKTGLQWQTIPGFAAKTKFDVTPLQVSSISVQPAAITGGNEALGNFTLSNAPGNNETIFFTPARNRPAPFWVKPLGSSCQETADFLRLEMALTQGVTSYTFKVCTSSVTAIGTGKIEAHLRSGKFETAVTIQP